MVLSPFVYKASRAGDLTEAELCAIIGKSKPPEPAAEGV